MRNPSLLGRCLRSRGIHSLVFILYTVTGRFCNPRTDSTLFPSQSPCFQGCRKSLLLMGTVFPNFYGHIF